MTTRSSEPGSRLTDSYAGRGRWLIRTLFIVLVPCLLFQLKLRGDTEPYPAILLPAGASLLHSDGSFTGFETDCVAEDSAGRRYPFSAADILTEVPSNYRPFVVDAGFGLNKERTVRRLSIPFVGYTLALGRPKTSSQIASTRTWLRDRIRRTVGIDPVRIRVLTYAIKTHYSEEPVRQERYLEREKTIDLLGGR